MLTVLVIGLFVACVLLSGGDEPVWPRVLLGIALFVGVVAIAIAIGVEPTGERSPCPPTYPAYTEAC